MAIRPSALPDVAVLEVFHKLLLDTEAGPTNSIFATDFFKTAPQATETDAGVTPPGLVAKVNALPDAATLDGALGSKADAAQTLTGTGLASATGSLGSSPTVNVPKASQAEAEAGSIDTKAMTPLRAAQATVSQVPNVPLSRDGFSVPATVSQNQAAVFNLAQDGGWGASTADNDRIMLAALNRSMDTGKEQVAIQIPDGTWPISIARTMTTTKPFVFRGNGRGAARVVCPNIGLFDITQQTTGAPLTVEGVTFIAQMQGAVCPLKLRVEETLNGPSPFLQYSTATLRDLVFVGSDKANHCFVYGMDLANLWAPVIDGIHFTGSVNSRRFSTSGMRMKYCFQTQVSNYILYYAISGIDLVPGATDGQNNEGFAFRGGEIIDVDYGVTADGIDADPGFWFTNSHVNASKGGLKLRWTSQVQISGNLIYKIVGDSSDFVGIDIEKCAYGFIAQNQILDSRSTNNGGTFNGLRLVDCAAVTVDGLQAQGWQNNTGGLVVLDGSTDNSRLRNVDAALVAGLTPFIFGGAIGKANRFEGTLPVLEQGLTVLSATPSVGNDRSGIWFTANSGATTITNFLDGQVGQIISVFHSDGVTGYTHSADLRIKGGASVGAQTPGTTRRFQKRAAGWNEI